MKMSNYKDDLIKLLREAIAELYSGSCVSHEITESGFYCDFDLPEPLNSEKIEALKSETEFFVYGMNPSAEAFNNRAGFVSGYSALFCDWLTELFGIKFKPQTYEWGDLIAGLETGEIDFTGELTATQERRNTYIMTDAIAERSVKYMQISGSESIADIALQRLPRFAFLEGTTTVDDVKSLSLNQFTAYYVEDYDTAYRMLKNGEIVRV